MREYTQEELRKIQALGMETLREFIRICEKYGLDYFAISGTAIGAVRHKGFIPWDDDMDVGMLREDYDRFLEVAPGELKGRYELYSASLQKTGAGFLSADVSGGFRVYDPQKCQMAPSPGDQTGYLPL